MPLSSQLASKYLVETVVEYYCATSGLRWYSPCHIGQCDLYDYLGGFASYYNPGSWDKCKAVELINHGPCRRVVDVGCGDGWLVRELAHRGVDAFGTDINAAAIAEAQKEGLSVFLPDDCALSNRRAEVLVSLQSLEHVTTPVEWLREQIARFHCRFAIIAVPAHDTMLGRTSDPLVWPPHHFTLWSKRALECLAERIGFVLSAFYYEPNTWARFANALRKEHNRRFWHSPPIPDRGGYAMYRLLSRLGVPWVTRAHSIIGILQKQ